MEEQWRVCTYDGEVFPNYEVSNINGRVRNIKTGRVLKSYHNCWGYVLVCLCKNGKTKRFSMHRLVAFTYPDLVPNDNPQEKIDVNHKDENKDNNSVENLEWTTHKQNCNHGTRTARICRGKRGKSCGRRKKRVKCIETGQIFDGLRQASEFLGLTKGTLSQCCNGKTKTCGKLHWEYVD